MAFDTRGVDDGVKGCDRREMWRLVGYSPMIVRGYDIRHVHELVRRTCFVFHSTLRNFMVFVHALAQTLES